MQHPASTVDMHEYPLTHAILGFEHPVWNASSRIPGGDFAVDAIRQDDGFGEGGFAFPAHFAVGWGADLAMREHSKIID